jgi:hypothetical protein
MADSGYHDPDQHTFGQIHMSGHVQRVPHLALTGNSPIFTIGDTHTVEARFDSIPAFSLEDAGVVCWTRLRSIVNHEKKVETSIPNGWCMLVFNVFLIHTQHTSKHHTCNLWNILELTRNSIKLASNKQSNQSTAQKDLPSVPDSSQKKTSSPYDSTGTLW